MSDQGERRTGWAEDVTGDEGGTAEGGANDRPRPLERPPSARYGDAGDDRARPIGPAAGSVRAGRPDSGAAGEMPSGRGWAIAIGVFAALIPAAILVVFAWLFGFSAGLIVVAVFLGRIVGMSVRSAPNSGLSSDERTLAAIVITLVAVAGAQVAIWLLALQQGGVLPFVDFLAETYGPVVPLEAMLGIAAAWWTAR